MFTNIVIVPATLRHAHFCNNVFTCVLVSSLWECSTGHSSCFGTLKEQSHRHMSQQKPLGKICWEKWLYALGSSWLVCESDKLRIFEGLYMATEGLEK